MELEVTPVFPTLIGRCRIPDADAMNQDLHALILAEEAKYASLGRSNIGGWHSRPDFLNRPDPAVSALTYVAHLGFAPNDRCQRGSRFVPGHAVCFRVGDPLPRGAYHAPHSHPDSAWSGVYYVDPDTDSPDRPLSGVLEFLDPRAGVEAVTAPGDPYGEPFRVRPQAGLLVIFPSWLYHWVHPIRAKHPASQSRSTSREAPPDRDAAAPRSTCRYPSHASSSQSHWR